VRKQFVVSTSPHIKAKDDIASIMRTVVIALVPVFVFSLYRFGYWSIIVTLLSVLSAVVTEAICQKVRGVKIKVNDCSAVVTGLLLAAVIPPNVSWYVPVVGSAVAIGIAKQCFGGLGANIWNPALIGRAFLQAAYPTQINSGVWASASGESVIEAAKVNIMGSFDSLVERSSTASDIITSATPLESISKVSAVVEAGGGAAWVQDGVIHIKEGLVMNAFLGNVGGCIGEVSAVLLLLGGLYLIYKDLIHWEVPVAYIGIVAILSWILPAPYSTLDGGSAYTAWFSGPWMLHVVGGGLFIGAFFMATDMVTNPMSKKGQFVFGAGCGLLTVVIRLYGGYPEGVCYSILLMNTLTPLIDSWTRPRVFGTGKKEASV
jgi:electron transport complex protein RnfD